MDELSNWYKRYSEDLIKIKEDEQKKGELKNGRRRWINKEIEKTKEKISELEKQIGENQ